MSINNEGIDSMGEKFHFQSYERAGCQKCSDRGTESID